MDNLNINNDSLSVVMPCYNEEEIIQSSITRLDQICKTCFKDNYEIILVDDGSTDSTWNMIKTLQIKYPKIQGLRLSRNHGHQLAILSGLSKVQCSLVLIIDADLQDPPELLPDMLKLMNTEDAEVVYGQRRSRAGESMIKTLSAKLFYKLLSWSTQTKIPENTGDFRLMKKKISDLLVSMQEKDRFTRGLVAWLGFKQVALEYDREARLAGKSKYTSEKMLELANDAFTGFSMVPLRLASWLSILMLLVSIALIIYAIISYFFYGPVRGWVSLVILISILSSSQFAILGIIGEYIGKIYIQDKARPLFIIREQINSKQ